MAGALPNNSTAVVVTYNPTPDLISNVSTLLDELPTVTVVDNGSSPAGEQTLAKLDGKPGCDVVRLGSNQGIAAALNVGVRRALQRNYKHIFTFDQDSTIAPGFVAAMLAALSNDPEPDRVGIVASTYLDRNHSFRMTLPRSRSGDVLEAITSGSLVPVSTFQGVGFFDENLFMDFVDIDFSVRCRRAGLRIIEAPDAILYHSVGRMAPRRILKFVCYPSNHSADRRYYIFRNRVFLMVRNFADWRWVLHQQRDASVEVAKIIMFEHNRVKKLGGIVRGTIDGLLMRMGKRREL
jgi:rhamnosyltransferase